MNTTRIDVTVVGWGHDEKESNVTRQRAWELCKAYTHDDLVTVRVFKNDVQVYGPKSVVMPRIRQSLAESMRDI